MSEDNTNGAFIVQRDDEVHDNSETGSPMGSDGGPQNHRSSDGTGSSNDDDDVVIQEVHEIADESEPEEQYSDQVARSGASEDEEMEDEAEEVDDQEEDIEEDNEEENEDDNIQSHDDHESSSAEDALEDANEFKGFEVQDDEEGLHDADEYEHQVPEDMSYEMIDNNDDDIVNLDEMDTDHHAPQAVPEIVKSVPEEEHGPQHAEHEEPSNEQENGEQEAHNPEDDAADHEDENPMAEDLNDGEEVANSSALQLPNNSFNQFATPSKSLPPLKDIDIITTPKSFQVARDTEEPQHQAQSSPLAQNVLPSVRNPDPEDANTSQVDISVIHNDKENDPIPLVASYLGIPELQVASLNSVVLERLLEKSAEFHELESHVSFLKLNQEKMSQINENKVKSLTQKLKEEEQKLQNALRDKEDLLEKFESNEARLLDYRDSNDELNNKITQLNQTILNLEKSQNTQGFERETIQYHNQITLLTKENIDKNQKLNELTKELSDVKNELFAVKLDLTKSTSEASHFKHQKIWFENEWKACQERFTNLSKTYQTERVKKDTEISELTAKNGALEASNKNLNDSIKSLNVKVENQLNEIHKLDQTVESSKIKYEKELQNKDEVIEILKIQAQEHNNRIEDLQSHVEEIQSRSSETISELEEKLKSHAERCIELEEKLRRTEEALEKELREENDLPKLTDSAELIASSSSGISLSSLYAEFNHIKKQLILERSQKEKLASELQAFVSELESKKPIILSYKEQISFYEASMKDMVGKIESIRFEKLESDKKNARLKSKIIEFEDELVSMKKLCKDLGKQLCYYLIHSKIHEKNENPLTLAEKNAIENILQKTGNNENVQQSDIDQLISDRLVGFASIIELQQKNAELLTITRELGKKLELQDNQANNQLESLAIEEAKDAILTLEGELDSIKSKYDAVTKERDVLKALAVPSSNGGDSVSSGNVKYLTDMNADLKKRLERYEETINKLQSDSSAKVTEISKKLEAAITERDELKLKANSKSHEVQLVQNRFENCKATLENTQGELKRLEESTEFWKKQASKQESLLITRNNELRDLESKLAKITVELTSTQNEKQLLESNQKSLQNDISQLKTEKTQLSEFVSNLQSLVKEREAANAEVSDRLSQSIANYQYLQDKLAERDEKLAVLASQSELALKAQNAKLEQVNELSYNLMTLKNSLAEKTSLVDTLNNKVRELTESLKKSDIHIKALQTNNGGGSTSSAPNHDNIELEQARHELYMAETQAREYEALAKSAEDTLVNVTTSFEEYKAENDAIKNTLAQEKDSLSKEIEKLDKELKSLNEELSKKEIEHQNQVNDLKFKLDESLLKAKDYDNLQAEYNVRIESVQSELQMYAKLADDNQKKYNEESAKTESHSREVLKLKEVNDRLNDTVDKLQKEVESLREKLKEAGGIIDEEKQKIEEDLVVSYSKIKDLEGQNNILLNQLELLKAPPQVGESSETSESVAELSQVINYIRREKESAEAKLAALSEEKNDLEVRLQATVSELEMTKSEIQNSRSAINVEDSEKSHQKLLEQLEQINILRESNVTLRNENEKYVKQLQTLQVQARAAESKANPLTSQIKSLNDTVQEKEQQIQLLKEENDRLMKAAENLNPTNEDTVKLQALQTRFDNLLNESRTKLGAARNKEKEYQKVVEQLRSDVQKVNEELAKAKEQHEKELAKSQEQHEKEMKAASANSGKNNKVDTGKIRKEAQIAAKVELDKTKKQFETEKNKLISDYESKLKQASESKDASDEWKTKYNQLEESLNTAKAKLEAEYSNKLEEEVQKRVKEAAASGPHSAADEEEVRKTVTVEYEGKIKSLQTEFSQQLEKEKADVRAQTEKKFEIKLRMLNKKLERLEAGNVTPGAETKSPLPDSKPVTDAKPVAGGFGTMVAPEERTLSVRQPEPSANGNEKKRGFAGEEGEGANKKPKE